MWHSRQYKLSWVCIQSLFDWHDGKYSHKEVRGFDNNEYCIKLANSSHNTLKLTTAPNRGYKIMLPSFLLFLILASVNIKKIQKITFKTSIWIWTLFPFVSVSGQCLFIAEKSLASKILLMRNNAKCSQFDKRCINAMVSGIQMGYYKNI